MIKAVIFDVGGVLKFETDPAIRQDVQQTLGITPEAFTEPWKSLTGQLGRGIIDEPEFWQKLHQQTGAQYPLPDESLLMREYKKGHQINNGVMSIARRLQSHGYKMAVLSNTIASHAEFNRQQGVYDSFDVVILSHEAGLNKPAIEIFEHTLKKLGVAPNEALLIDDKEKNTSTAQTLGMNAILFENVSQLAEEIEKMGIVLGT